MNVELLVVVVVLAVLVLSPRVRAAADKLVKKVIEKVKKLV